MNKYLSNRKYKRVVEIYWVSILREVHIVTMQPKELPGNRLVKASEPRKNSILNRKQPQAGNILRNRLGRVEPTA